VGSLGVNLDPKRKDKSFQLSFGRQEKSVQVLFWVNLNHKAQDKLFLSFRRQYKLLQVSRQVKLNQ